VLAFIHGCCLLRLLLLLVPYTSTFPLVNNRQTPSTMNGAVSGVLYSSVHQLVARNDTNSTLPSTGAAQKHPPSYKLVGLTLAIASGCFIGVSFVLKKLGLLKANLKYNEEAGEGYGYLKNAWWWGGMTLMILGEICNFAAYLFADAILVTPLGALSVVITAILSGIFLKERLSFVGKIGCFNCIIGAIVIAANAPAQSAVDDIQEMKRLVLSPGFLVYAGVIIIGCAVVAIWVAPKYGKKSMMVYLTVCSLIGGLSVICIQGIGAAITAQARGEAQFNQWFLYVVIVFVIVTLVTEIIYLNVSLILSASKGIKFNIYTESSEPLQCRFSYTHILCLFHIRNNRFWSHFIPGFQGYRHTNHYSCSWIPANLFWCCPTAVIEICQRYSGYSCIFWRP
jgi:drug/metabolite transporter (DMT)-like permease